MVHIPWTKTKQANKKRFVYAFLCPICASVWMIFMNHSTFFDQYKYKRNSALDCVYWFCPVITKTKELITVVFNLNGKELLQTTTTTYIYLLENVCKFSVLSQTLSVVFIWQNAVCLVLNDFFCLKTSELSLLL